MPGRLNIFQRTMLQWDELHPYNAIHVVRLPATLDLEQLNHVIRYLLVRLRLTGLELDGRRGVYRYQGGPAQCEVKLVSASDPHAALTAEIEQHLNTRFASGSAFSPFRFFVVPANDAFSLGLVYFHAVADAEAVVFLLQRIVKAYLSRDDGGPVEPLEIHPEPRDGLLRQPVLLLKKLAALPGLVRNTRRSIRPNYHNPRDTRNGFTYFTLPPDSLPRLIHSGKAWGVTVNDLFLALLLRSLAPLAASRQKSRRRHLSLGCIVNLRRELGLEGPRTFGLFLGSFMVTQAVSAGAGLREIAAAVHEQTERVKRRRLYRTSALELGFARRMLGLFSTERRKKLYQKNYPLWGGLTNMNLNALWPQPPDGKPVDYFRAVCTGPATPLVLSVTTAGAAVNAGLSFRRTVFSPTDIGNVQEEMLNALSGLEMPA
jgi:NRPS condensation-like uncharacterized protein